MNVLFKYIYLNEINGTIIAMRIHKGSEVFNLTVIIIIFADYTMVSE